MQTVPARLVLVMVVVSQLLVACASSTTSARSHDWPPELATSAPSAPTRLQLPARSATTDVRTVLHAAAFVTPSGRITCLLTVEYARCDYLTSDRAWSLPEPYFCDLSWGWSMFVARATSITCVGDNILLLSELGSGYETWHTASDPTVTWNGIRLAALPDGAALGVEPYRCDSGVAGVTCRNMTTGHGFTMSQEAYKIF